MRQREAIASRCLEHLSRLNFICFKQTWSNNPPHARLREYTPGEKSEELEVFLCLFVVLVLVVILFFFLQITRIKPHPDDKQHRRTQPTKGPTEDERETRRNILKPKEHSKTAGTFAEHSPFCFYAARRPL